MFHIIFPNLVMLTFLYMCICMKGKETPIGTSFVAYTLA